MLGIQNNYNVSSCRKTSFAGSNADSRFIDVSSFDSNSLDDKSRATLDELKNYQNEFDAYADKFSNSDSKAGKKAGKVIKFLSGAIGLAGVFVLAKGGFKASIETVKSFVKSDSVQKFLGHFKGVKTTISDAGKAVKDGINSIWNSKKVKSCVDFVRNSKVGKRVTDFFATEKGKAITEPLKNIVDALKNPAQYTGDIQSVIENVAAGVTTGSVAINKIAGVDNKINNSESAELVEEI